MKHCQETGRTITTLIMQLAEEAASDQRIELCELARILRAVENVAPIYELASSRCRRNKRLTSVLYQRNQLLGRILCQPLESQLYACPPLLDRSLLAPMLAVVAKMVGETVYADYEEQARTLYFGMIARHDHFEWPPFFSADEAVALFCKVVVLLCRAFKVYEDGKKTFMGEMRATWAGFTGDDYFLVLGGLVRPMQVGSSLSRHRAFLENSLTRSDMAAVDGYIEALNQDRQRWRALASVRCDVAGDRRGSRR